MKRILCILIILLILCGCKNTISEKPVNINTEFSKGVWLSYNEINTFINSEDGFKESFDKAAAELENLGITDLYFHVHSHCDSVFESEYFPQTDTSKTVNFDIFKYVTDKCHNQGVRVHAWINPYRVDSAGPQSPKEQWLKEKNADFLKYNGIYLDPSSGNSRKLLLDGVSEILEKYDVDGIHFDDYFYPTADPEFDKASYEKYINEVKNPLSLYDWRRANVDILISDCKNLIEKTDKDVLFSISPAASITKNYDTYFADIELWVKNGLIDEVIPQLYFGFNHPKSDFCFEKLLKEWKNLCKGTRVSLKIGLAPYKIGYNTPSDGDEWAKNEDILARQSKICLEDNSIDGVVFFSYTHLFSAKKQNTLERNNLREVLSPQ